MDEVRKLKIERTRLEARMKALLEAIGDMVTNIVEVLPANRAAAVPPPQQPSPTAVQEPSHHSPAATQLSPAVLAAGEGAAASVSTAATLLLEQDTGGLRVEGRPPFAQRHLVTRLFLAVVAQRHRMTLAHFAPVFEEYVWEHGGWPQLEEAARFCPPDHVVPGAVVSLIERWLQRCWSGALKEGEESSGGCP